MRLRHKIGAVNKVLYYSLCEYRGLKEKQQANS